MLLFPIIGFTLTSYWEKNTMNGFLPFCQGHHLGIRQAIRILFVIDEFAVHFAPHI